MEIKVRSIVTGKVNSMDIDIEEQEFVDAHTRWLKGELIQRCFPNLSNTEREFILTGMSEEEQNEMFKETEE